MLGLALVFVLIAVIITTPIVQTEVAQYATKKINDKFNIKTSIGQVAIQLDGSVLLKKVHVLDDRNNDLAYIGQLRTNLGSFKQLTEGKLLFGSTELHDTHFYIHTYKGDSLNNLDKFIAVFDDGQPGDGSFYMKIDYLELFNGHFRITDENTGNIPVDFKEMDGSLDDFKVQGPNIKTEILSLSFLDQRGVRVEEVMAEFMMTPTSMDIRSLVIETEGTSLKADVEMRYEEGGLKYFTDKVHLDVSIQQSKVATNDLMFFYKEFGGNNLLYLDTKAVGYLNDFKLKNTQLSDKNGSEIIGNFVFKNLFNSDKSFRIDAQLDRLSLTRGNAVSLLPNVLNTALPEALDHLKLLFLTGNVTYEDFDITADVETTSALGFAKADVELFNVNQKQDASYKGVLFLDQFDVGTLLGNESIGFATLNALVDGKSFDPESFQTVIKSEIQGLDLNNYTYENILIDGNLKYPAYTGTLVSKDPNALLDFNGTLDFSLDKTALDFKADVELLNMNALRVVEDSLGVFSGHFELKGTGKNLDTFEGTILAQDATYSNSHAAYSFDYLHIDSAIEVDSTRMIIFNSEDIVNGFIRGKFQYNQLLSLVENTLGGLYKNYAPIAIDAHQFVEYDLEIENKIVDLLVPRLLIGDETKVSGRISADEGEFVLNLKTPFIHYNDNKIVNLHIDVNSLHLHQNACVSIDTVDLGFYRMHDFVLNNSKKNDTLYIDTYFKGGNESKDTYKLNFYHTIDEENTSIVGVQKSEMQFKESIWFINEFENQKNRIVFNKKIDHFEVEEISLSHKNQLVLFHGSSKGKGFKDLNLSFNNVELDKITPDLESLTFAGLLNGAISFVQEESMFKPNSSLTISDLGVNDVLLGMFQFDVQGDQSLQNFTVKSNIVHNFEEVFYLNGGIGIQSGKSILNLDAGLNKLNLKAIEPFLSSIMSDIRGEASGRATVSGTHQSPDIQGKLYLTNAGMRPVFTGVDYLFDENSQLDVTEGEFILREVNITDSKSKTRGVLNGVISHNGLKNWYLDTRLSSGNLLALDLPYQEGTPYFGTAFINGFATIIGPVEALEVNIEASSMPGTKIKIPLDDAGGLGDNNFIHFLSAEEKENRLKGLQTLTNANRFGGVQMNFEFNITPDAEIEILLDSDSGHGMKGNGYGFITMEINTLGRFDMWGDFMVYNGEYHFKYGGIIDKKLDVEKYGTIRWDGEPLNAILNLKALYRTQSNPGIIIESSEINRKVDTDVAIVLQGNLSNPEIDFLIDFPNVSSSLKSEIDYKLTDKDTRETQAMALLATGGFITSDSRVDVVYGSLFERASSLFDDLFSDAEGKFQFGLNYSQSDRNPFSESTEEARVGVTFSSQISDRVLVNSKLGVPIGGREENVIVGDLEVQLLLNQDGSLRARVFNRENTINYLGEGIGYTQGVGLTYEVEFNTFKELLTKIFINAQKRVNAQKNIENQPMDASDDDFGVDFLKFQEQRRKDSEVELEQE